MIQTLAQRPGKSPALAFSYPGKAFPHEIGVFLGYPIEDVIGFINNKGCNFKCCGYWKVYGDKEKAIKEFARYDKCRMIYTKLWNQGRSILKLTVAA